MNRKERVPPTYPTEALLHEAALRHLTRYAATRAGLLRVLERRVARWAASAPGEDGAVEARAAAGRVVDKLVASGAVSDAVFAAQRRTSLQRAGKSARAIGAHLAARGVPRALAGGEASAEAELAAAIHVRKRRLGAFRTAAEKPETRRRELASLARAGFGHGIAAQALALSRDEAEAMIIKYRASL